MGIKNLKIGSAVFGELYALVDKPMMACVAYSTFSLESGLDGDRRRYGWFKVDLSAGFCGTETLGTIGSFDLCTG